MFQYDQCSDSSSTKYDLKRHERLKQYSEQCGKGIKRKHYTIQHEKGVEKNGEEDTESVNGDDTDMEDLEETLRIDKVTFEENSNRNFADFCC